MLLIFDFDGVIADSEVIANQTLADVLTEVGMATSLEDSFRDYMGRHWEDCLQAIEARWGRAPTVDLRQRRMVLLEKMMRAELKAIAGVEAFLTGLGERPKCIASSSRFDSITGNLDLLGLRPFFADDRIFSAARHVTRGKPHPDIYLHAAAALDAAPERTVVIEDSPIGVTAAVAAGMTVIGLCAGSHIRDGHADALRQVGAHHIAGSYDEVARVLRGMG